MNKTFALNEYLDLYYKENLGELMAIANDIRYKFNPEPVVTWIIDRNINITNICSVQCKFCNFCVKKNDKQAYVTSLDEYRKKINELILFGGDQILLQGGLNVDLGLNYYTWLFSTLKAEFPILKIHALGPPEIIFLAKQENKTIEYIIDALIDAGLTSLPGAGAEILSNRVRKIISPAKCTTEEWLEVMRVAHLKKLVTSATMMFGHIETIEERIVHLIQIRELQDQKPDDAPGFMNFVLWPIQFKNTRISKEYNLNPIGISEYVRMLAISRIILYNIPHIQPSWLTVGKDVAQLCLHAGADDMGSIMIEENVVSTAGAEKTTMSIEEMKNMIIEAGFIPKRRNQRFEILE
ncbi:MAG: CofH family radical SAM protein [Bacteroidales bacterium]|nr:CofH family radical SAM protein [Bacteroidales bacterium]